MKIRKVDVIIPTYRPGKSFGELLRRLEKQEYPINKIIVMNTEEAYWEKEWEEQCGLLEVHHQKKEDFDHGGTRHEAAALSQGEVLVFLTQDAMPADRKLIGELLKPFEADSRTGAVYARQLPAQDCNFLERYTRSFNYPEQSCVKTKADLDTRGIKTYFCSNVCAAYQKEIYDALGGFVTRAIFNEDMIYAGKLIQKGYQVVYAAEAKVIHSHNYSGMQQFHRNFDLGVSQAEHPEIFEGVPSEGEGLRLVKKTAVYTIKKGKFWLLPVLFYQSACKYAGYLAGKHYKKLPAPVIRWCTMNPGYWKK